MIFNELYSAYYNTVAKIITEILNANIDKSKINNIIKENAFGESFLNILPAIKNEKWQIITKSLDTPIKNYPRIPLTNLEKSWLKAILQDDRIKLFDIKIDGLDDIQPLFTKDDYRIYDKYLDGDDYNNEEYIIKFKTILYALHNKIAIKAEMKNKKGEIIFFKFIPQKIEYSEKDDKFRVITSGCQYVSVVNIAKLTMCKLCDNFNGIDFDFVADTKYSSITLMVTNKRNALERVMLHFAHFEKIVEKIDDQNFKLTIKYDIDNESEMVIRVLSFGPLVKVIQPNSFIELIKNKLKEQIKCELK